MISRVQVEGGEEKEWGFSPGEGEEQGEEGGVGWARAGEGGGKGAGGWVGAGEGGGGWAHVLQPGKLLGKVGRQLPIVQVQSYLEQVQLYIGKR